MSNLVSTIRNLGPASDAACARAGIDSAEQLRALGADEAYRRLLRVGHRPHFIGYYAMVMGLEGRRWNDARGREKIALRRRFDALKAEAEREMVRALAQAQPTQPLRPHHHHSVPLEHAKQKQLTTQSKKNLT